MGSTCCAPFPICNPNKGYRLFDGKIKRVYVLLKGSKTKECGDHIKTKGSAHDKVEMFMVKAVKLGDNHINVGESGTMMNKIQSLRVFENINYDISN